MKKLAYKNASDAWIKARELNPLSAIPLQPGAAYMAPEDMNQYLSAIDPYDLYLKPTNIPSPIDYETSAFNVMNSKRSSKNALKDSILVAGKKKKNQFLDIVSALEDLYSQYTDIPGQYQKFIPRGIVAHEQSHEADPRLNPMANNYGWLKYLGMPGNIASREMPAIKAEDKFWWETINNNRGE